MVIISTRISGVASRRSTWIRPISIDLVITVDTAVAHLAGAMGKKVWVLLPWMPDWRWMLDRSDNAWYPTATLFRQSEWGNWEAVVREVSQALAAFS